MQRRREDAYNSSSKHIAKLWRLVDWSIQNIIGQHWCDFLWTIPLMLTNNKEVGFHNFTQHEFQSCHFPTNKITTISSAISPSHLGYQHKIRYPFQSSDAMILQKSAKQRFQQKRTFARQLKSTTNWLKKSFVTKPKYSKSPKKLLISKENYTQAKFSINQAISPICSKPKSNSQAWETKRE